MDGILSYKGYSLVFEDGFDGPALDQSRWNVELHPPGWVNEELQEYVDSRDTITLEDSKLLIRPVNTQIVPHIHLAAKRPHLDDCLP